MNKQSFTEELKEHLGALEAKLEAEIGENIKLLGDLRYYEEMRIPELERQLAEARAEIERKDKLLSIVGEVANNALYFNDNSDYEKALWEILAAAKPELFAECEMPRLKFISTSNETAKKGN